MPDKMNLDSSPGREGAAERAMSPPVLRAIDSPLYEDFVALFQRRPEQTAAVNWQKRSAEEIEAAAEYGLRTGTVGARVLQENGIDLAGTILELGPGFDLGGTLILGE